MDTGGACVPDARAEGEGGLVMSSKCSSCGAEILWAITERGRRMPLSKATERRAFIVDRLTDGSEIARSRVVYDAHWTDCPNSEAHRSDA